MSLREKRIESEHVPGTGRAKIELDSNITASITIKYCEARIVRIDVYLDNVNQKSF